MQISRRCILYELQLSVLPDSVWSLQRKRARLQSSCKVNSPHLGQDQELYDSVAGLVAEADITLDYATNVIEDPSRHKRAGTVKGVIPGDRTSPRGQSSVEVPAIHAAGASQPPSGSGLAAPPQLPQRSLLRASRTELDIQDIGATSPVSPASPPEGNRTVIQWIDNLGERDKGPRRMESTSAASTVPSSVMSGGAASTMISDMRSNPSGSERLISGHTSWTLPSISGSSREKAETSDFDDFDDDGITVELARNIVLTGQSALGSGDHRGAKGCFLEALTLVQQLPIKARAAACDMLDLWYNIAMCCLVLDGQAEVEKTLLEVLQHEPSSDVQREQLFHVSHGLAQLYVTTGRLSLARQSCNNALRGRRKLLGKDHQDYYSSLALMARISEIEGADIQAKAYKDMIPAAEQHKFAFDHVKMDVFCEKEAVELADSEHRSLSSEQTIEDPASHIAIRPASGYTYGAPPTVADRQIPSSKESLARPTALPIRKASSVYSSVGPGDLRSRTMSGRFTDMSGTASEIALQLDPLSSTHVREPASVPLPNPGNDYLGFCKAAWQLQVGDRSALKKTKQSSLGSSTTYWLCCTGPKCQYNAEIETSAIGTWESIDLRHQKRGVAYRFAFLAKSHVRQNKVAAGQALYKCQFCSFLGMHTPIIQGTEAYIDHVSRKHRAGVFSQVILHRIGCVNDRICTAEEEFDINLYPIVTT